MGPFSLLILPLFCRPLVKVSFPGLNESGSGLCFFKGSPLFRLLGCSLFPPPSHEEFTFLMHEAYGEFLLNTAKTQVPAFHEIWDLVMCSSVC